jgi:integrase
MLTDLSVSKMQPPATRREVPDGKIAGLYLMLTPNGAKSWVVRYRSHGEQRKLTLGTFPALSIKQERQLAEKARGQIAGGGDPAGEKKAARAAAKAEKENDTDLVENVVAQFVARHAKPNTRDWKNTEAMLKREVVARWRGKRLRDITRPLVYSMLDEIVDRGAPVAANRVAAQFRKLCNWAVSRGLIASNPFTGITAPTQEKERERVLSDEEIRLVWEAFERVGWPFGPMGKLLLMTGGRLREVAGMRWSELDIENKTWTLPPARSKNRRELTLPLSAQALTIIESLPRIAGDFVFTTTSKTPVSGFSKAKWQIDTASTQLNDGAALKPWTFHDLRRTTATGLQKLGVRLEVTEAVLNHVSGSRAGVVGVYQLHDWADEKRAALDAWARRLDATVSGEAAPSNVVELARDRA